MAHTLFDVFQGGVPILDNQTALAVQSLLDSQVTISAETNSSNALNSIVNVNLDDDENDVFQCGKCKKQFTTLEAFIRHKRETCTSLSATMAATSLATSTSIPTLTSPGSGSFSTVPGSSVPQVVLNEADLLSLAGIDAQALTIPLQAASSMAPYLTRMSAATISTSQSGSSEMGPQITALSPSQPVMLPLEPSLFRQSNTNGSSVLTMACLKGVPLLTKALVANSAGCDEDGHLKTHLMDGLDGESVTSQSKNDDASILCTTTKDGTLLAYSIVAKLPTVSDLDATVEEDLKEVAENDIDDDNHVINELSKDGATKIKKRVKTSGNLKPEQVKKKTNKLHCTFCQKGFSKNFDLQQHIRSHTGEKPFQCIVCGRAFAQKSNVKKHMQTHKVWPDGLSNTLPKQPLLSSQNEPNASQQSHDTAAQMRAIEKNSSKTSFCEATADESSSKNEAELSTNYLIDNSYVCQYCNQTFKTYCQLKTHLKIHKNEQVYKCTVRKCGQTFQELDAFLDHMKSHEDELKYRCHVCTKQFHSLFELRDHQYSHNINLNPPHKTESRHYRCTKCMNKYSTPEALDHHMATSTHSYPCVHCKKVFPCERYLRRHLPIHGSTAKHTCTVCNGSFRTEHYLRMHMLIHSGDKPFQCWQCSACFNRKDKLKRHSLIHEPVKRFKCPFCAHNGCSKAFHRPDKLKAHILTHSGFRPYQCYQCGRGFSRRAHMREHMRLHEEENNKFTCKTCGKGFSEEAKLKDHSCTNPDATATTTTTTTSNLRKRCTSRPTKIRRTVKKSSNKLAKKQSPPTESGVKEPIGRRKAGRPRKKPVKHEESELTTRTEESADDDKMLNSVDNNEHLLDGQLMNSKQLTEMQTMVENIVTSDQSADNNLTSLVQGPESVLLNDNSLIGNNTTYVEFDSLRDELQLDTEHNYNISASEPMAISPCKDTKMEDNSIVNMTESYSVNWESIP